MNLEPIAHPAPNPFWADFTKRIMLARQCGFLSGEETEDYIVFWGLVAS